VHRLAVPLALQSPLDLTSLSLSLSHSPPTQHTHPITLAIAYSDDEQSIVDACEILRHSVGAAGDVSKTFLAEHFHTIMLMTSTDVRHDRGRIVGARRPRR
jgi:hypothetical protein